MSQVTITLLFLLFAIVMFMWEKIPLGLTSMIVCVGLIVTGVLDWKTAFSGFIDSNVILFVAMFIVGGALFETGMANKIGGLVTKFARTEKTLIIAIMVIVGVMSGFLSNTGTAAVLIPVVCGIADESGYSRSRLLMPLVFAAALGGNLSIIGAPGNLMGVNALQEMGLSTSFFMYAPVGIPMLIVGILYFIFIGYKFLPDGKGVAGAAVEEQKDFSDVPKWKQIVSLVVLVLVILAMIFEEVIGISIQLSACIGAIVLVVTGVLSEKEALASIDLKVVLLFGGSLTLAKALDTTGAGELIADKIVGLLGADPNPIVLLLVIFIVTCALTNFMSNTATTALMIPIAVSLANNLGADPRAVVIATVIAGSCAYATPIGMPANTMVVGLGGYKFKDYVKSGLPLILVSFVVLKFSITFTISEEFREIGVMKAIGISSFKIRSLYLAKYLMLAVAGAVAGFLLSIPFSNLMLRSVSNNIVLGADNHFGLSVLGAVLVIVVILLFAFRCTGLVKKSSPIDAIRSGQTGERYKKKSSVRLGKSHGSTSMFLAVNDVLSAPRRYATIVITFFICTLFVLVFVNLISTMRSDTCITTFGSRSDLYYTDLAEAMSSMNPDGLERVENYLRDTENLLEANGMPAKMCVEAQYKYKVRVDGNDYSIVCEQGIDVGASDYEYTEGIVPQSRNEIAITPTISKLTGAKMGDTVTIDFGTETLDCIVVAYFQSMNQLGAVIRLHEDAPTDFSYIASLMSYQINFTDHPSAKEVEIRKDKIKQLFDNDKVMNAAEYCDDCMGAASTIESVQYLLLGITLIVVLLVCILMEQSFLADERSQIAILKAIGFSNSRVIRWHVIRFGIVTLAAVFLAGICSIPATYLIGNPIFGMMGAVEVSYVINPWKIFLLYPGIIFLMTLLASGITALQIRTIKSSDTANIE